MNSPFGISQYTSLPLTFAQDLVLYRSIGVNYIEICEGKMNASDPDSALRAVQDAGFTVSSVQPRFHSPFPNSLRKTPTSPGERMAKLRKSIKLFSAYFPGTTLVLNTGIAPNGNVSAAYRTAVKEFKSIAKIAFDAGVRVALEPLNPVYMNTDTFICSLAEAKLMIDEVDHPALGVFLDLWHFWAEASATLTIAQFSKKIFGVHVSDWRRPRAFADRLLPGSGAIPIVPLLKTIRKAGYRGIYTLEIFSDKKLPDSLWANPKRTVVAGQKAFIEIWKNVCA
jgi:sugar phosphate isomerase/epimerase